MCDSKRLREVLVDIVSSSATPAGILLKDVVGRTTEVLVSEGVSCTEDDVRNLIGELLGSWAIEKTLDYLSPEEAERLDVSTEYPVWHLRIVDEDKRQFYLRLSPAKQELIRILYEQDSDSTHIGQMRVSDAAAELGNQGYSLGEYMYWVRGVVDEYNHYGEDGKVRFCGILSEYDKDPEHLRALDELTRRRAVKDDHFAEVHQRWERDQEKKKGAREKRVTEGEEE